MPLLEYLSCSCTEVGCPFLQVSLFGGIGLFLEVQKVLKNVFLEEVMVLIRTYLSESWIFFFFEEEEVLKRMSLLGGIGGL